MTLPGRAAGCPAAPPQTRTSPIKAYGSSEERFCSSDMMNDPRFGQRVDLPDECLEAFPRHAIPLPAAPVQPPPQALGCSFIELSQAPEVTRDAVIGIVPLKLAAQPSHQL